MTEPERTNAGDGQPEQPLGVTITIRPNGPYLVEGPARLMDAEGNEYDLAGKARFKLCRCGASVTKPFCDGAHSRIGFVGAERAVLEAEG